MEQLKRQRRRRRRPEPATLGDFVQANEASVKVPSPVQRQVQEVQPTASPDNVKPLHHTSRTKRRSRTKAAILRSRESTRSNEDAGIRKETPSMRFRVRNLLQKEELEDPDELDDLVDDLTTQFEAFGGFAALRVINETDEEREKHGSYREAKSDPGDIIVTYNSSEKAVLAFAAYQGKRYGGVELECTWFANPASEANDHQEGVVGKVNAKESEQAHGSDLVRKEIKHTPEEVSSQVLASLLQRLADLQERAHQQNPWQDVRSKRLILGLKEVQRSITTKRMRLLFVGNDIESCDVLESKMAAIMDSALKNEIPVIQSLSRRQLGRYLSKNVRVSCVGVCSIDGANEYFQEIMSHLSKVRPGSTACNTAMDPPI